MSAGYKRQNTPTAVERQLRQEAGFGCAECGHPYIEYHHIVPFAEEQHFRPEDMVALCGNCHPAIANFGRDRQYEIKRNPHNMRTGQFNGALQYDKRDLVFKVGGNWYENTPTILQFHNLPIISCTLEEGQAKVSLNILGPDDQPMLTVQNNDISFRVTDVWDFEYGHRYAVVRHGHRDIALRMDFRKTEAIIEGKIWLGGKQAVLGPNETTLPTIKMTGNRMSNVNVGIQIGPYRDGLT